MMIPFQLDSIRGKNGIIEKLVIKNMDEEKELKVDYFLPFFGLSTNLGPIKDWELELEKNILKVKQETCETNLNGIFAIGDVCSYPGKLNLSSLVLQKQQLLHTIVTTKLIQIKLFTLNIPPLKALISCNLISVFLIFEWTIYWNINIFTLLISKFSQFGSNFF